MTKTNPFFRGIPTNIDVDKLIEKYGVPKPGVKIQHTEIATLIGATYRSHRYATVVHAWRCKLERESNVILGPVAGEGFVALTPAERVGLSVRKFKGGLRATGRAGSIACRTDRAALSDEEKRVCDHVQSTAAALRMHADQSARAIKWDNEAEG